MKLIEVPRIQKGAVIGILSAAGGIDDFKRLENAKKFFENLGYKVKISPNAYSCMNYLSASDEMRVEALSEFFLDESINAIIAARGGYGSIRIIKKIDYEIIKKHPKIFAGHSDITALSLMIYKNTGLAAFSAPMAYSDFGSETDAFTQNAFFNALENNIKTVPLVEGKVYKEGYAKGVLWGGNLTTIASLCGQDFVPDEKFILFAEDISEPVYKIDRAMTQLLNIDKFKNNLCGIVLGDFIDLDSQKMFDDYFYGLRLDIPVKSGLKIGHKKQKLTLPIGVMCEFDTHDRCLKILQDYLI